MEQAEAATFDALESSGISALKSKRRSPPSVDRPRDRY